MRVALTTVLATLTLGLGYGPLLAQTQPVDVPALESIHMVDALTGWAVTDQPGAEALLRTTDGGTHWRDVTPVSSSGGQIRVVAVAVLTSLITWVSTETPADATRIFHTANGGRTWRNATIPAREVNSIHFIDARIGWLLSIEGHSAGANQAVIYHSTDSGETWIRVSPAEQPPAGYRPRNLPFGGYKWDATFLNATIGWVTGADARANVLPLYVTHDGGRTWQQQKPPPPPGVTSRWFSTTMPPKFFTARDGIVPIFYSSEDPTSYAPVGSVVVFYGTHDGGTTWTYTTPVPITQEDNPSNFVDVNHGWVADGGALYVTSDGGRQWRTIRPTPPFAVVRHLDFVSPLVGWAVRVVELPDGSHQTPPFLLKTLDGGRTWVPVTYTILRQ